MPASFWSRMTAGFESGHLGARTGGRQGFVRRPRWHAWRKEQAARQVALGKQIPKGSRPRSPACGSASSNGSAKATKARQTASWVKQIEKVKKNAASVDPQDRRVLAFDFAAGKSEPSYC